MAEISRFFGIRIRMYHEDHGPPHFHATYGEHSLVVEIGTGAAAGRFPPRARRLVLEWYHLHEEELIDNWRRAMSKSPLERIDPLE